MVKVIAAVLAVVVAYLGFEAFRFLSSGPGRAEDKITFEVSQGATFRQVAERLEKEGLILSARRFRLLGRVTGQSHRIKKGEYLLHKAMTPQEIMGVLVSGKSIQYPVTFPEGTNIFEMAQQLESKGFFKAADFLAACRDKKLIHELLGIEVSSLEGYLFPETYNLTRFTTLKELLVAMVQNFKNVMGALESQNPGGGHGLSRHELVTLASVVEKETGAPEERPMIASVFYNRLNKNMRLQSDPTIIYGIWVETGRYKENITKADITRPTRYNTYTVPRLPFGPIANPGKDALAAVFRPAKSDYFFFVSRNDGTHVFTKTYEDHSRAVREFQLNPAAREGKSWRDLRQREAGGASGSP